MALWLSNWSAASRQEQGRCPPCLQLLLPLCRAAAIDVCKLHRSCWREEQSSKSVAGVEVGFCT